MRLEIRGRVDGADATARDHAARRLQFALGRFAGRVARVVVVLSAAPNSRGRAPALVRCRAVATLPPDGRVAVEVDDLSAPAAVDRAADRLGQAVGRELGRRRDREAPASTPGARRV